MTRLSYAMVQALLDGNKELLDKIRKIMPSGYDVYLYTRIRDGKEVPVLSFRSREAN